MHICLELGAVCIGQSPCTFEFDYHRPFYDEICAQVANHKTLEYNGYYAFGFVTDVMLPQKNLQGIVIDALGVTRTKCLIDSGN